MSFEFFTIWSVCHTWMSVVWAVLTSLTLTVMTRMIGAHFMAQCLLNGALFDVICSPRYSVLLCAMSSHHRRQTLADVLGAKVMGHLVWVFHLHVTFSVKHGFFVSSFQRKMSILWDSSIKVQCLDVLRCGQKNTRVKIERLVLSPWLSWQLASCPRIRHFPLLDMTTYWSWSWQLSTLCTPVRGGGEWAPELGHVDGYCFLSSSHPNLHNGLFVTSASEQKAQC